MLCVATGAVAAVVPFTREKPITPVVYPGLKPDSIFGSTANDPQTRNEQIPLGVKWFRASGAQPSDQAAKQGYDQLPIELLLGTWDHKSHPEQMIDPKRWSSALKPEFIDARIQIDINEDLKPNPELKYVEFYNEHWWMYQDASMVRFRDDMRKFYQAVKSYNKDMVVLAGNSTCAIVDDIAVDGGEQWLDGFAPHNYTGTGDLSYYDAPFWKTLDWSNQLTIQYHKKYQWMTEGGYMPQTAPEDQNLSAYKMVQQYAASPSFGIQKVIMYMPKNWNNAQMYNAYKIMTTLLEDKKPVAQLWPASSLSWGEIFAEKGQSVAVLWNHTGSDPRKADAGTIVLHDAAQYAAYDIFGQPCGEYDAASQSLTMPIGNPPVYILGNVDAGVLQRAIENADIRIANPLRVAIEPFAGPVGAATPIRVRMYNGGVKPESGVIDVTVPGWTIAGSVPFKIDPAKWQVFDVPVTTAVATDQNLYSVTTEIKGTASAKLAQTVQAAYMTHHTPRMDGSLDDWQGNVGVRLATYPKGIDETTAALNPDLAKTNKGQSNNLVKVHTAYDNDYLYIAYEVTGQPNKGEWLEVALGLSDWSKHNFRSANDPLATKGHFIDSDYIFAINNPTGQLWLMASPTATFRTPYNWMLATGNTTAVANPRFDSDLPYENAHFFDLLSKGKAKMASGGDSSHRVVECAIARSAIPEFKPESGLPIRFTFAYQVNADGASSGGDNAYEWGRIAGEFPFEQDSGTFVPSWKLYYPNQLQWGVK